MKNAKGTLPQFLIVYYYLEQNNELKIEQF